VDVAIALDVGDAEPVELSVSREDGAAYLMLGSRQVAEIRLAPAHLEVIRDQLPGVLAEVGLEVSPAQEATQTNNYPIQVSSRVVDPCTRG
jgi:hypothetical protein